MTRWRAYIPALRPWLPILMLALIAPPAARTVQAQAVNLSGVVRTRDGAPLPGATVTVGQAVFVTGEYGQWAGLVPYEPLLRHFVTAQDYVARRYGELQLSSPDVSVGARVDVLMPIFEPDAEAYGRDGNQPPTVDEFVTDTGVSRSQVAPADTRRITVSGTVGVRGGRPVVRGDGYLERPDGLVDDVDVRLLGERFEAVFPIMHGPGVYRVEINDATGGAVINVPVFVGVAYVPETPIWPSEADLVDEGPVSEAYLALDQVRAEFGLAAYALDERLAVVARDHVGDMLANRWLCHCWADGSRVVDHIRAAGLDPVPIPVPGQPNLVTPGVGNAIATLPGAAAIRGLMTSPGHRKDLLGPYTRVGIAYGGDERRGTGVLSIMFALVRS